VRIKLELEDFKFVTTAGPYGDARWLMVKLAGKPFTVIRTLEPSGFRSERYMEHVDECLVEAMQRALEGLLLNAADLFPASGILELQCPSADSWKAHYDKRCNCGKRQEIEDGTGISK
jgi:hypothetical protein